MIFDEDLTPVDIEYRRKRSRRKFFCLCLLLAVSGWFYWRLFVPVPIDYVGEDNHFKYGSIGADTPYGGIPFQVWKMLPNLFPEYLPEEGAGYLQVPENERTYLDAYATFGFVIEQDRQTPIGFSRRHTGIDLIGFNCAVCHTGTVRVADGIALESIYPAGTNGDGSGDLAVIERRDPRTGVNSIRSVVIPGMPAITVDLEAYFAFLFRCAEDKRFTVDHIMGAVADTAERSGQTLGPLERIALRTAIPRLKKTLNTRRKQLHYIALLPHQPGEPTMPRFGPGRVDTFSPYKSIQFSFPWDGKFGIADYPSLWNQRPREGWDLHWDGNNSSVLERNLSASLGAGASPTSIDLHRLFRVAKYTGSPPPPNPDYGGSAEPTKADVLEGFRNNPFPRRGEMQIPQYPFSIHEQKAATGKQLFKTYCYRCHGWKGDKAGSVEDISSIKTDAARLDSYTEAVQSNQNLLGVGHWWRLRTFKKTNGYTNSPLDGVWARGPYLHNGSVPTLRDLCLKPCQAEDLKQLGIDTPEDLEDILKSPADSDVAKLIDQARKLGYRPPVFYRGDDRFDPENVGFRCNQSHSDDGRKLFLFSAFQIKEGKIVPLEGNGNQGHYGKDFGTQFSQEEVDALIEYQKLIGQPKHEVKP